MFYRFQIQNISTVAQVIEFYIFNYNNIFQKKYPYFNFGLKL